MLFGGSGFIGSHLAHHLLDHGLAGEVAIADLRAPGWVDARHRARITYVETDVRRPIDATGGLARPDLIVNLAAIHREPGHAPAEYFETNVHGAEHVCRFATETGCETVVFTSSISVYGPTETVKDERSLPVPTTPYGASKLVAERIHVGWQEARASRRLAIVRPGVVFGPREGGNVTRLVKAVTGGYFVYCGNHHVKKAGGYVKELCEAIAWALDTLAQRGAQRAEPRLVFNFTLDPTPELQDFVAAVAEVAGRRPPRLSLPYGPVLAASHLAHAASRLTGIHLPLHPVRARKLVRSNHIASEILRAYGYQPRFTLASALADWKRDHPADWAR